MSSRGHAPQKIFGKEKKRLRTRVAKAHFAHALHSMVCILRYGCTPPGYVSLFAGTCSLLLARPRLTGPVVGLFQKKTEIARRQLIRICFSVAVTKLYLE